MKVDWYIYFYKRESCRKEKRMQSVNFLRGFFSIRMRLIKKRSFFSLLFLFGIREFRIEFLILNRNHWGQTTLVQLSDDCIYSRKALWPKPTQFYWRTSPLRHSLPNLNSNRSVKLRFDMCQILAAFFFFFQGHKYWQHKNQLKSGMSRVLGSIILVGNIVIT